MDGDIMFGGSILDAMPNWDRLWDIIREAPTYWSREKTKNYPLYAFFLHTEKHKDVAEYLSQNGAYLHAMTGKDCLIILLEKPSKWDEDWKNEWKRRLGSEFEETYTNWEKLTNFTRDSKVKTAADLLNVPINHLPCMIFIDELNSKNILEIPFVAKKEYYDDYFADILTCIQTAGRYAQGDRLNTMSSAWNKYWIKWIASQKLEDYAEQFQKWGSIITKTKDTVVNILDLFSPIIKAIKTAA